MSDLRTFSAPLRSFQGDEEASVCSRPSVHRVGDPDRGKTGGIVVQVIENSNKRLASVSVSFV